MVCPQRQTTKWCTYVGKPRRSPPLGVDSLEKARVLEHSDGGLWHSKTMLYPPIQRLDAVERRRNRDTTDTVPETCPNDDPHCPGPEGEELPCFPCFAERGEGAGR
jgi:hypothetical protein